MSDNLSIRKNIRLKYYDYSIEGYYFITICTKNRLNFLGNISVGVALQGDPKIILTEEGKIVKKNIEIWKKNLKNILIDEYIIMPNHVHLIVVLSERVAQECDPYNSENN